jgi:hypothetical protein
MTGGGAVSGWFLEETDDWAFLAGGLEGLAEKARACGGPAEEAPFLYAVGDGNHSLAAAKAVWEEYKGAHAGEPGLETHPARWVLVEIENLHDPGVIFEPIHRVIFGVPIAPALDLLAALPGFSTRPVEDAETRRGLVGEPGVPVNRLGLASGGEFALVETPVPGPLTGSLQPLLDRFVEERRTCSLDYLHGAEEALRAAGARAPGRGEGPPATALILPPVPKKGFFQTVARQGPLPRKSFSMGEAEEKRFYLECRTLFG